MLGLLAITVVAATLGLAPAPSLNAWESAIALKPAQVFCWNSPITAAGHEDGNGYTDTVGGTQTYLDATICNSLLRMRLHKKVDARDGAAAFFVLTHEAFHLRGVSDESQTDCDALHAMPGFLRSLLHYTHAQIHTAMMWAWITHYDAPPLYTQDC